MTGRTLDEIAESWDANTDEWCDDFPVLLAIAQGQREELGATKRALRIACEDLLVKSERIKLFEGRITSLATLPEEEFDAACGPENGTQVQFGIRAGFVAGWKYSVQKLIGTKK